VASRQRGVGITKEEKGARRPAVAFHREEQVDFLARGSVERGDGAVGVIDRLAVPPLMNVRAGQKLM
jgi:hypothetical protein